MSELVSIEKKGYVTIFTINRPKALNALNKEVLQAIEKAFDSVDVEETRCIILTGSGEKAFVAGADIGEMSNMTEEEGRDFGEYGNKVFRKVETCPVPVIAAINGFALGGGNELAMSCDIRIASENAVFGQPEVGLGITPGFGGTQRLARVIGSMSIAKEILYTGKNIKAPKALEIGLVNSLHPLETLMEEAMKLANTIASNAPTAIRSTKEAIAKGIEEPIDQAINTEAKLFGACFATEDQKEGMSAFLEKRKEKNFKNK